MIKKKKYISIFTVVFIVIIGIFILLQQGDRDNPEPINVILIVIDALRSDHLSCYGYERNTSPDIDRLSKEGLRFTQAIAAGGWTVDSVPSILTGTYSPTHQIRRHNHLRNSSIKTIAWQLARKGYRCVLWSNHITLKFLDIKDGFQDIYVSGELKNYQPVINGYQLTTKVIDWLEAHKYSRFFLYIHYHGCHLPYRPPEPYKSMYLHDEFRGNPEFIPLSNFESGDEKFHAFGMIPYVVAENNITDPNYYISRYDGAISYADAQIGRLIDGLKKLGLDENTLIILTADHGEMLGEHNRYFAHMGGFEENIRVPLIIRFPELFPEEEVISRQVSLIDIAPTILEVTGLDKPAYMQGESLLAFITPFRIYQTKYAFSFHGKEITLRTENWKLFFNGNNHTWELYNLKEDPKEHHNLVAERPHKFRRLKQVFENYKQRITSPIPVKKGPPLTEEDKERLRSLGYAQ